MECDRPSGYAIDLRPVREFLDQGLGLLREGIAQLWGALCGGEREAARAACEAALPQLAPGGIDLDRVAFRGPAIAPERIGGGVVDRSNGFRRRPTESLHEIQRSVLGSVGPEAARQRFGPTAYRTFHAAEIRTGASALDRFLQDVPPRGETQHVRQGMLIEYFRSRGISSALGAALVDDLIKAGALRVLRDVGDARPGVGSRAPREDALSADRLLELSVPKWVEYWSRVNLDPEAVATQRRFRVVELQQAARDYLNTVSELHFLPYMQNWQTAGRRTLEQLRELNDLVGPWESPPDPFRNEQPVELGGVASTSDTFLAHRLAEHAWHTLQLPRLTPASAEPATDEAGREFFRTTLKACLVSPLDEPWTEDTWREVCLRLGSLPEYDLKLFEASLNLEFERAFQDITRETGAAPGRCARAVPSRAPTRPSADRLRLLPTALLGGRWRCRF